MNANSSLTPGALDGLRVLDYTRVLAGPLATMVLADLGAEVTKIERPDTGDETRSWGPPWDDQGRATYFESVNRNKRPLALDLSESRDAARAMRLSAEADVIIENFRPGVMHRFGLDYESVREHNENVIFCSITGFGNHEGSVLPGYDLLVQALGGLMSITGPPEGEPQKVGVALVDVIAGLFATVGILAAVRHRDTTGEGQRVEVDLLSSSLAALANQGAAYTAAGVVPARLGNAHPSISPYDLFPTATGELVLAVGNDRQFARLCSALDDAALAANPRFLTNRDRVENREQLREHLERRLATRSAVEWSELLAEAGVPAGPVNDIGAAFELAGSLGLDPIVELAREDRTTVRLARNPIGLSATPPRYETAPPELPT